ncbi:MAG: NERD domain-containing protein [Chloroflexi bacterium]|nr:MAG: NERD domain-containing protein [Chloroflexota bacterium]
MAMVIIRDDQRVARMRRLAQYTSLIGMGVLVVGLILAFVPNIENFFLYQLLALLFGWMLSQVGIFLAHRYLRDPRPDEVLDEALRKVARNGRLYHYVLPAPHVLLLPDGIIVLVPKYQRGQITVEGDKWRQGGLGLRRFFGQEALGNPTREAEDMVGALVRFIKKEIPELQEETIPIAPLIVFTSKEGVQLNAEKSRIPAMHYMKVKGFLRKQQREPMPAHVYNLIRDAFDRKAAHLLEYEHGASE